MLSPRWIFSTSFPLKCNYKNAGFLSALIVLGFSLNGLLYPLEMIISIREKIIHSGFPQNKFSWPERIMFWRFPVYKPTVQNLRNVYTWPIHVSFWHSDLNTGPPDWSVTNASNNSVLLSLSPSIVKPMTLCTAIKSFIKFLASMQSTKTASIGNLENSFRYNKSCTLGRAGCIWCSWHQTD